MHGYATRSVAPVSVAVVIAHSAGHGTSSTFSKKVLVESDTGTPSLTSASAAFRLAGVIRLSVPSWSSAPQRPQLDNWVCHASYCASLTRGCGREPCDPIPMDNRATMAREQAGFMICSLLLQECGGRPPLMPMGIPH